MLCLPVMLEDTVPWDWLEKRRAAAFLLAGLLQLIVVALFVLRMETNLVVPELMRDLGLAAAQIPAFIALLGFVPELKEQLPRVARAGGIFAALAVIGILFVAVAEPVGQSLFGLGEEPPVWMMPILLFYLVGGPLTVLIFAAAILRTGRPSRSIGAVFLVLFVSYLVFFHWIPLSVEGLLVQVPSFVIALGFLASGFLLRAESAERGRMDHSNESAVR